MVTRYPPGESRAIILWYERYPRDRDTAEEMERLFLGFYLGRQCEVKTGAALRSVGSP
jgi:hypothetical protein